MYKVLKITMGTEVNRLSKHTNQIWMERCTLSRYYINPWHDFTFL